MKEEFNLSEKILTDLDERANEYLYVEYVKEFIKRLKIEIDNLHDYANEEGMTDLVDSFEVKREIDKLAGEKLVE